VVVRHQSCEETALEHQNQVHRFDIISSIRDRSCAQVQVKDKQDESNIAVKDLEEHHGNNDIKHVEHALHCAAYGVSYGRRAKHGISRR